ncbi:MAG: 50S ribosomal protein L4 [Lachnospiraceae bacterium]|nr:50S ribosomal protein L4 [Lachnospiraceae bacterium]MDY5742824.1 50S ribosomal protein L4 [Lachnospiraceae bacterium]
MAKVSVYNMEGTQVGDVELLDSIFNVEVNEHLVHMAVVNTLANRRQGTQSAKTRSEVSGGGRKPWRQKGTGHARQGSTRSPQWTGGGVVFAPKPRDYSFKMNKKERRFALKSVLTDKVQKNALIVLDQLSLEEVKTKNFKQVMDNLKVSKALVVIDGYDKNIELSARNLQNVLVAPSTSINVYDILRHNQMVVTKDALDKIQEVYA